MKHLNLLIFVYFLSGVLFTCQASTPLPIIIKSKNGEHAIAADAAISRSEQETGLMNRKTLADNYGMLFPQPYARRMQMWMKDTLVPLDMLFIDHKREIIYIKENAKPLALDPIGPDTPIIAVLELPGGTVQKLHVAVGDSVQYRLPE